LIVFIHLSESLTISDRPIDLHNVMETGLIDEVEPASGVDGHAKAAKKVKKGFLKRAGN